MPMDETWGCRSRLGGRSAAVVDTKVRTRLVGDLQTELVTDFFDVLREAPRPTYMPRCSTAARTTTRLSRCSRLRSRLARGLLQRPPTRPHATSTKGLL